MGIYIKRHIDQTLQEWKKDEHRKPLLLRGARQVGKSSTVRNFAKSFDFFVEINFDESPQMKDIFTADLDVRRIVSLITSVASAPIIPGRTLLFFDEIQQCPQAISSLRYFYEQMPQLHVVAAGSLLEFALASLQSFGVGRVQSLYMHPMTFDEFLSANNGDGLLSVKQQATSENPLLELMHNKLVDYFRTYLMVGGMPEAVTRWIDGHDFKQCQKVHKQLIESYEDDFTKYRAKTNPTLLRITLKGVAGMVGGKITYSRISSDFRNAQIKEALEMLQMAGLIIPVTHTSANGLPLGAESNTSYRKFMFIDSGLMLALLGMDTDNMKIMSEQILIGSAAELVNKGGLAEMVAGLELVRYKSSDIRPELFYWQRAERNSTAEIDYLQVLNGIITPIEVKAGIRGGMKSMFMFLNEKRLHRGIRTSLENFSTYHNGDKKVDVIPLYALSNIQRL